MIREVFDIYEKLWTRAQRDGAVVHYYTWVSLDPPRLTSDPDGASGWFDANEDGQPIIKIYRLDCDDDPYTPSRTRGPEGAHLPPPDLHEELITLAHEYGHLRSFLVETERREWTRYNDAAQHRAGIMRRVVKQSRGLDGKEAGNRMRAALLAELADDDCERILREETLAWKIGREVLAELLMTDFKRYDERREQGLHAHRYRLGREDAWPSDLERPSTTE